MSTIWKQCQGEKQVTSIKQTAWRVIEAQEVNSTRKLVDSIEEQMILEDIIENNKPNLPKRYASLHPLLYTPFRYPPLKHGSRFGRKTEPSLWYGSIELKTAMAEKAFIQLHFLRASEADYNTVELPLTAFATKIQTDKGIVLVESPFKDYTHLISSPISYEVSQALGSTMREAGIEAFSYFSARDTNQGVNIGLFNDAAFAANHPHAQSFQSWRCTANKKLVEFTQSNSLKSEALSFSVEAFMIENQLPFPAN